MTKWEYDILKINDIHSNFNILDIAGARGWELVSVSDSYAYLKRPIQEPVKDDSFANEFSPEYGE